MLHAAPDQTCCRAVEIVVRDGVSRNALESARYFLSRAQKAEGGGDDVAAREEFGRYLEAAIVFGRTVTFRLQSEFSKAVGFRKWYEEVQARLGQDRLCKFFNQERTLILKQRPLQTNMTAIVLTHISVSFNVAVETVVVRGNPWYRRSPRIIVHDLLQPLRQRLHKWRQRRDEARKERARAKETPQPKTTTARAFYLADQDWKDEPAVALVRRYLDTLEPIIAEAEAKFGDSKAT
jgi:hypothetical protein